MKNKNIQTEIDACFLYQKLADHEQDVTIAHVFRQMSEIEKSHAEAFSRKAGISKESLMQPSWRAKSLNIIGKVFGYDYVLGVLMDTEKSISNALIYAKQKNNQKITGSETNHVTILRTILEKENKVTGTQLSKFESRHRSVGGNAIRAAVLGGNDGLVSNFSLVMGIAGATAGQDGVLLAGLAGLLAGALSMALGEWISVKSSQELYENQMQIEMEELETNPEGEMKELTLIYVAKGIPDDQARMMAADIMKDKSHAHEVLVKEELGINAEAFKGSVKLNGQAPDLSSTISAMKSGAGLIARDRTEESVALSLSIRENMYINPGASGRGLLSFKSPRAEAPAAPGNGTAGCRFH